MLLGAVIPLPLVTPPQDRVQQAVRLRASVSQIVSGLGVADPQRGWVYVSRGLPEALRARPDPTRCASLPSPAHQRSLDTAEASDVSPDLLVVWGYEGC